MARDLGTGQTSLVSQTPAGDPPDGFSTGPVVSDDGSLVSFGTSATDITGSAGAIVFDRSTHTSTQVMADTPSGAITVDHASLSGDGEWLAFDSSNAEIVPGDDNGASDAFVMNRDSGEVTLVSRSADGTVANATSWYVEGAPRNGRKPVLSADGSMVVFMSDATDLAGAESPGGGDGNTQAYAFELATGLSELVTVMPDGTPSDDRMSAPSISPDGRYIAVRTQAFLAGHGGTNEAKLYVRDLKRNRTLSRFKQPMVVGRRPGRTPAAGRVHHVHPTRRRGHGQLVRRLPPQGVGGSRRCAERCALGATALQRAHSSHLLGRPSRGDLSRSLVVRYGRTL